MRFALGFLNDQFYRDPDHARKVLRPFGHRIRTIMIRASLFDTNHPTGKAIKEAFGDLIDTITFDETSLHNGATGSFLFEADVEHMRQSVQTERPSVVICFGKVALEGYRKLNEFGSIPMIVCPHPSELEPPEDKSEMINAAAAYWSSLKTQNLL